MDRRRSLLAASQTGGGGKKVNRGVAVVAQTLKSFSIALTFEFPCASTIVVMVSTSNGSGRMGITQGSNRSIGSFTGQFLSFSYSPSEDDTYIYEIVIEQ